MWVPDTPLSMQDSGGPTWGLSGMLKLLREDESRARKGKTNGRDDRKRREEERV